VCHKYILYANAYVLIQRCVFPKHEVQETVYCSNTLRGPIGYLNAWRQLLIHTYEGQEQDSTQEKMVTGWRIFNIVILCLLTNDSWLNKKGVSGNYLKKGYFPYIYHKYMSF